MGVFILLVLISALTVGQTGADKIQKGLRGNSHALEKERERGQYGSGKQKVDASAPLDLNAPAVRGTAFVAAHSKAAAATAAAAADPVWPSEEDTKKLTNRAYELGYVKVMVPQYILDPLTAPTDFPQTMIDDFLPEFKNAEGNDEGFQEFLAILAEGAKQAAIKAEPGLKEQVFEAMRRNLVANPGRLGEISADHKAAFESSWVRLFGAAGNQLFQKFLKKCEEEFKSMSAEDRAGLIKRLKEQFEEPQGPHQGPQGPQGHQGPHQGPQGPGKERGTSTYARLPLFLKKLLKK